MSKFIDKLNQVSQVELQPIGFRATLPASPKPKIQLVASLTENNIDHLADFVAGADAGLLQISNLGSGIRTLQKMHQIVPDIPWGGWLRDIDWKETKQEAKLDCDFLVFTAANTSLAILQNNEVGRILEVEASLSEGLLRTVDELPVDAVLIANDQGEGNLLTWRHLMIFQRFADLLAKPLLISAPPSVTADELQTLWRTGVDGVIVKVGVDQPAAILKGLRQTIDKLTFPAQHKQKRTEALLPYVRGEERPVTEEEE